MDDETLSDFQKQAEQAFPGSKVVYTAADDKWQGRPTLFVNLKQGGALGGPADDGGAGFKALLDRLMPVTHLYDREHVLAHPSMGEQ